MNFKILSVDEERESKYPVPIPQKHKNFEIPADINQYITDLLPNIYAALSKIAPENREYIVGRFVIYILGETKSGVKRYMIYNPAKYNTIPYYKWFLSQVRYFALQDFNENKDLSKQTSLTFINNEGLVQEKVLETAPDPFDIVYTKNFPEYLQRFTHINRKEEKDGQKHFENHAFELYQARVNKIQKQEFAQQVGVSNATVTQWLSRLETLFHNYFSGDYVDVLNNV